MCVKSSRAFSARFLFFTIARLLFLFFAHIEQGLRPSPSNSQPFFSLNPPLSRPECVPGPSESLLLRAVCLDPYTLLGRVCGRRRSVCPLPTFAPGLVAIQAFSTTPTAPDEKI